MKKDRVFFDIKGVEYCDEERALAHLLYADVLFSNGRPYITAPWNPAEKHQEGPETVVLFVNCNDFFAPAADAEELPHSEIGSLYKHWKADKRYGPMLWAAKRRKCGPWQKRIVDHMKAIGSWNDEWEQLPKPRY